MSESCHLSAYGKSSFSMMADETAPSPQVCLKLSSLFCSFVDRECVFFSSQKSNRPKMGSGYGHDCRVHTSAPTDMIIMSSYNTNHKIQSSTDVGPELVY